MSENHPPGPSGTFGSEPRGPQYQGPQGGQPPTGPGQPQNPYGQPGGYGPYPGAQPPPVEHRAGHRPGHPAVTVLRADRVSPPPAARRRSPPVRTVPRVGLPGRRPRRATPSTLIIIGAVVLALLALAITGGVLLLNRGAPTAGTDPNTGGSAAPTGGPGGSTAPPLAVKPSDAVKSYLEALAAGQAETALALGDERAGRQHVPDRRGAGRVQQAGADHRHQRARGQRRVRLPGRGLVQARQAGGQRELQCRKAGDQWRLRETYNDIDLSFSRSAIDSHDHQRGAGQDDQAAAVPGRLPVHDRLAATSAGATPGCW